MKRVLILGGGFGGIATARRLKQTLDEKDEVILVDQRETFMVGFRKTWTLTGQSTLEEGQRPLDSLTSLGIRVMHDPVTRIDPASRTAWMGDQRLSADAYRHPILSVVNNAGNLDALTEFIEHLSK